MKKSLFALGIVALLCTGCSNFDRDTFNALSVSNAELKQAQTDYEPAPVGTGKLPHTACVFNLITKGKIAQGVAETAFLDYYTVDQSKGDVTATQAAVIAGIAQIAPIVASIKTLSTNPNCGA